MLLIANGSYVMADTTPPRSQNLKNAAAAVEQWSSNNKLRFNVDKCKEVVIDFKLVKYHVDGVTMSTKELELVGHAKLLRITISNTLQCNNHISDVIKRANKRSFYLIFLRRANVPSADMFSFYCTCIYRPVQKYYAPVFHHALPAYLSDGIREDSEPCTFHNISGYVILLQSSESLKIYTFSTVHQMAEPDKQ